MCRPRITTTSPATCEMPNSTPNSSPRQVRIAEPTAKADAPSATKTVLKPATKPSEAVSTRRRSARSRQPSRISSTDTPEIRER